MQSFDSRAFFIELVEDKTKKVPLCIKSQWDFLSKTEDLFNS